MTTKIVGYFTSIFFILSLQKFCDKLISLSLHYYNKHETWRHIFLSRHKNLALVTSSWLRKLNVDLSHYKDNVQPAVSPPSPTLSPSWAELIFLLLFFSTFLLFFFLRKREKITFLSMWQSSCVILLWIQWCPSQVRGNSAPEVRVFPLTSLCDLPNAAKLISITHHQWSASSPGQIKLDTFFQLFEFMVNPKSTH